MKWGTLRIRRIFKLNPECPCIFAVWRSYPGSTRLAQQPNCENATTLETEFCNVARGTAVESGLQRRGTPVANSSWRIKDNSGRERHEACPVLHLPRSRSVSAAFARENADPAAMHARANSAGVREESRLFSRREVTRRRAQPPFPRV